jgi:hypothetical protein
MFLRDPHLVTTEADTNTVTLVPLLAGFSLGRLLRGWCRNTEFLLELFKAVEDFQLNACATVARVDTPQCSLGTNI